MLKHHLPCKKEVKTCIHLFVHHVNFLKNFTLPTTHIEPLTFSWPMTYPLSTLSLLLSSPFFVLFPSLLFLLASDFLLSLALFCFLLSSSSLFLFLSFLLGLSCPALTSFLLWVYLWFLGSCCWGFLNTPQNITIHHR